MRDQVHHYMSVAKAFEAMASGEVSAVMGMRAELEHSLKSYPDRPFKKASNGFPGISKPVWDVGIAIRHTHRALGYAVEGAVDRMIRNGEVAQLYQRHGLSFSRPGYYDAILGPEEAE